MDSVERDPVSFVLRAARAASVFLVISFALGLSGFAAEEQSTPAAGFPASPVYVGLRRSSYGLRKCNSDDAWWAASARAFATNFSRAEPLILEIISNYQADGSTEIEFSKPSAYRGPTTHMTFRRGNKLDHERALATYDGQNVKALLQFEPGKADVCNCFDLAQAAFGNHPCLIGLAIDAEWFKTKQSRDGAGLPISDSEAKRWMEKVLQLNPGYILVLKHFQSTNLPRTYRHPHLWLLTDSQEFASRAKWLADMRDWAQAFKGSPLGSQYGYPKDQRWWSKESNPPVSLGQALTHESSGYRMLLWVDFTADRVSFGQK